MGNERDQGLGPWRKIVKKSYWWKNYQWKEKVGKWGNGKKLWMKKNYEKGKLMPMKKWKRQNKACWGNEYKHNSMVIKELRKSTKVKVSYRNSRNSE